MFSIKNLQVSSSVSHAHYDNPLTSRYASPEMAELFGEQRKFGLWRRLWVVLAEAEREMGLNISLEQLDELLTRILSLNFRLVILKNHAKDVSKPPQHYCTPKENSLM